MYQANDYNAGVSQAPSTDIMDDLEAIVKSEVNIISRDIAQQVADAATANLVDRFALKVDLQALTTTVSGLSGLPSTVATHSSQLTDLNGKVGDGTTALRRLTGSGQNADSNAVLGGASAATLRNLTSNVLISSPSGGTTYMQWNNANTSPVQAIDYAPASTPTLSSNTMMWSYTDTAMVAKVADTNGNLKTFTLKDTAAYAAVDVVNGHTTSLARLSGDANKNAVLGSASLPVNTSNNVVISNGNGTTFMKWNGTNGPVQSIDYNPNSIPTLSDDCLFLSYTDNALKANIRRNASTTLTLELKDASAFSTTGDYTALSTRVTAVEDDLSNLQVTSDVETLQHLVKGLDGSNTDNTVVLGQAPATLTAKNTYICNYNAVVLQRWPNNKRSSIQAVDASGSAPTLSEDETMCITYDSTNKGLVATVLPVGPDASSYTVNLHDADRFVPKRDANNNVLLGKYTSLSGSGGTYICNYGTNANNTDQIVLIQWPFEKRSGIHALDPTGSATALLDMPDKSMHLTYDTTKSALVAQIRVSSSSNMTLNLMDVPTAVSPFNGSGPNNTVVLGKEPASTATKNTYVCDCDGVVLQQWPASTRNCIYAIDATTSATAINSMPDKTMNLAYDTTNSALVAQIRVSSATNMTLNLTDVPTAVSPFNGSGPNKTVVLGKAPASTATKNTYVCDWNGVVLQKWPESQRSCLHAIDATSSTTAINDMPDQSISFSYDTINSAFVVQIRWSSSSNKTLSLKEQPPLYREIKLLSVSTTSPTLSAVDHPNSFVVYNPTTSTATGQTITICNGLSVGMEIEIMNMSANPVTIAPSPAATGVSAGVIHSVSSQTKIQSKGAAIIKVYMAAPAPVYFLIGSLMA
jgi:hypothetical protein